MCSLKLEVRDRIAWVTFDSGGPNTLSREVVAELRSIVDDVERFNDETPLHGVILKGNANGLGVGADLHELAELNRREIFQLVDDGHSILYRIEGSPVPWIAVTDGYCLGGIFELALACKARLATPRSTIGLPETTLNLIPGLGGTQRLIRLCGLLHPDDPGNGNAPVPMIITGKILKANDALAIGAIDAIIPDGADHDCFAANFLAETLPTLVRTKPDLSMASHLPDLVRPMIMKATGGREHPRAPFEGVRVIAEGAKRSLPEGNRIERDAFMKFVQSREGKAGIRFFLAKRKAEKLPPELAHLKQRNLQCVGVGGGDGTMGNAILFLGLQAKCRMVAYVPSEDLIARAVSKLRKKYGVLIEKRLITSEIAEERIASVEFTTDVAEFAHVDLVIEALYEQDVVKAKFFRDLRRVVGPDVIVASNSSSMGPEFLSKFFAEGGGNPKNVVGIHFFNPAEHPSKSLLVEVIRGYTTSPEVVATVHTFVRRLGKTPLIMRDGGSVGFLVNAGLMSYFAEAEKLYREGTPIETIDRVMREHIFPMGPFTLLDYVGINTAAGMLDFKATVAGETPGTSLICKLSGEGRGGAAGGGGFYDWQDGKPVHVYDGLAELAGTRGDHVAGDEEIVHRCVGELFRTVDALCSRGIVDSSAAADLAFVLGTGFLMHLGGPIFWVETVNWQPWSPRS